jgi:hypothetical protein
VLSQGGRYLGQQAGIAVATDLVMIALYAWYLVANASGRSSPRSASVSV